ncbi:MAG: LytTR family transcriptional regulator DNA-binding domain-containing protein [Tannerella sp.]|nr:LytTR family transcriptional regulator DNA-binding domain-containing protein [Tannerella sp.]
MKTNNAVFNKWNISLTDNKDWIVLQYKEIVYIKAFNVYTEIILSGGKTYYVAISLDFFEGNLPDIFFRIHRAVIVNMGYVQKVHNRTVTLKDSRINLSVSCRNERSFKQKLENNVFTITHCTHCETCPDLETCEIIKPYTNPSKKQH